MNTLAGCRTELRLLLGAAGVSVIDHIPERVVPPAALLEPGSPYMEDGETFCELTVRFQLVILAPVAVNEVETNALDQLICDAIDALDTWNVERVDQPQGFEINNAQFLGARIYIRSERELTL